MTAKYLLGQFAALLAAALLLTQPTAAQGSKWWQSEQYRRDLGLTTEQSRRLGYQRSADLAREVCEPVLLTSERVEDREITRDGGIRLHLART